MDNYKKINLIGEGTFGKIFKCLYKPKAEELAIKKIFLTSFTLDAGVVPDIRETRALAKLKHVNIIDMKAVVWDNPKLYIVLELMKMDLAVYIRDTIPFHMSIHRRLLKSYLYQLLQGIKYCHDQCFLHRDLKTRNILIDAIGNLKIADFSIATFSEIGLRYRTEITTPPYKSPEMLLGSKDYFTSVDLLSASCIFAEMASKNYLFAGNTDFQNLLQIFGMFGAPPHIENWKHVINVHYSKMLNGKRRESLITLHNSSAQMARICFKNCCYKSRFEN